MPPALVQGPVVSKLAIPLQRPQFFEPNGSDGEIRKDGIRESVVPVEAEHLHCIRAPTVHLAFKLGRFIRMVRPGIPPVVIQK